MEPIQTGIPSSGDFNFKKFINGRLRRMHFVIVIAICVSLNIAIKFFFSYSGISNIIAIPVTILIYVAIICRLHDIGFSGWWSLLYFLIQSVLSFVSGALMLIPEGESFPSSTNVLVGIFTIATVSLYTFLLLLIFKRGSQNENRFGPVVSLSTPALEAVLNQK